MVVVEAGASGLLGVASVVVIPAVVVAPASGGEGYSASSSPQAATAIVIATSMTAARLMRLLSGDHKRLTPSIPLLVDRIGHKP